MSNVIPLHKDKPINYDVKDSVYVTQSIRAWIGNIESCLAAIEHQKSYIAVSLRFIQETLDELS